MKHLILSLAALCYALTAAAQTHEQVLEYYKKVNLAELALCDSNFSTANKYYSEAFAINSRKAFYHDLSNAFYSAMDSHEYSLAEKYFAQLMHRGLDSEHVAHIMHVYRDEQLARVNALAAKYPNYMAKLRNEPLVKELKHLVFLDQDVRYHYYNDENLSDYMTDSTFKVDAMDAQQLLKILKKNGIPSQAVFFETNYDVIMWHNKGAGYGGYESQLFDTLLYNGVFRFDYDAKEFAKVIDGFFPKRFSYKNTSFKGPLTMSGARYIDTLQPHWRADSLFVEVYDSASEAIINKDRAKIGLESLSDLRRKTDAINTGLNRSSLLHKYAFQSVAAVTDFFDKQELEAWLRVNGKDAPVKKAYNFKNLDKQMDVNSIEIYALGKLTFDSAVGVYKHWLKEYNQGQVYYGNWKNDQPPLPWNYHAEVIENPHEKLTTDIGRANKAKFVTGYKFLVEWGTDGPFMLRNMHLIFGTDSTLIYFSGKVQARFNMVVTSYCGKPDSMKSSYTTNYWRNDKRYKITLETKRYVWQHGDVKTLVTIKDELNENGTGKTTTATYELMDVVRYNAYLQQVAEKKKELDKEYAKVEKR